MAQRTLIEEEPMGARIEGAGRGTHDFSLKPKT